MNYPQNPNDCFGLLRSYLQDSRGHWQEQFCGLLRHVKGLEPEIYEEQWLPYLHDVWTNGRANPLRYCLTLDALADWVELAPFAHFWFEPQCDPGDLKNWIKSPLMAHVSHLDLGRVRLWSGCFETLFEHGTLPPLHTLILGGHRLEEHNFDVLWHHRVCQHLEVLDLSHNEIGSRTIAQIIDAPLSYGLAHLHLRGCGVWQDNEDEEEVFFSTISQDVIALLSSAAHLNLKTLDVSDNTPEDTLPLDLSLLLIAPQMAHLEVLNLEATTPSDETIHVLSMHSNMRNLKDLDLDSTWLEEHQIVALAQSPHLANVTTLSLEGCVFAEQGCKALAQSTLLHGIQTLVLSACEIGPKGAVALFEGASFDQLETLCLDYCKIGPEGALSMALIDLRALQDLILWSCWIGDEGLDLLLQNTTLAPKKLELNHNELTGHGVETLLHAPILKNIEHLSLWGNPIGSKGVDALVHWTPPKTLESIELYDNHMTRDDSERLKQSSLWHKVTGMR